MSVRPACRSARTVCHVAERYSGGLELSDLRGHRQARRSTGAACRSSHRAELPSCRAPSSSAWQKVIDSDVYTFIHEVNADGVSHRYRAVDRARPRRPSGRSCSATACTTSAPRSTTSRTSSCAPTAAAPDHAHRVPGALRARRRTRARRDRRRRAATHRGSAAVRGERRRQPDPRDRSARSASISSRPMLARAAATGHTRADRDSAAVEPAPQIVEVWTSDRPLESRQDRARLHLQHAVLRRRPEHQGASASRDRRSGRRRAVRPRRRVDADRRQAHARGSASSLFPRFEPFFG